MIARWRFLLAALLSVVLLAAGGAPYRDASQVRRFRHANTCPSTGATTGACPGFVVDHIVPLCAGGPDRPENMQWQGTTAAQKKDVEERAACRKTGRRGAPGRESANEPLH